MLRLKRNLFYGIQQIAMEFTLGNLTYVILVAAVLLASPAVLWFIYQRSRSSLQRVPALVLAFVATWVYCVMGGMSSYTIVLLAASLFGFSPPTIGAAP